VVKTFKWYKWYKVITVIYNIYMEAKSCVRSNNVISDVFSCNVGVRQGENLSPLLFAIFLNDLESSLRRDGVAGLNYINDETIKHLSNDDVEMQMIRLSYLKVLPTFKKLSTHCINTAKLGILPLMLVKPKL
jgi:hypothetical protein